MSVKLPNRILDKFYVGDNVEIMGKLPDECVDLIYLDPPFFTQRRRYSDEDSSQSFDDIWPSFQHYGRAMRGAILQSHRVLSPAGSLWLHLDDRAILALSSMTRRIFRSEPLALVCIKRTNSKTNNSRLMPRVCDYIAIFSKDDKPTHNPVFTPADEEGLRARYVHEDEHGKYCIGNMYLSPNQTGAAYVYRIRGVRKRWQVTKERMIELYRQGKLHIDRRGLPNRKYYLHNVKGSRVPNLWDDIVGMKKSERVGFPTQKSVKLLDRIITIGSDEGDVVLDPFAGSGTALLVAEMLNRHFIGIDRNPSAKKTWKRRVECT